MTNIMTPAEIMDTAFDILRKNIKTIILYGLGFGMLAFVSILLLVLGIALLSVLSSAGQSSAFSIFLLVVFGGLAGFLGAAIYFAFGVGFVKLAAQKFLDYQVHAVELIKSAFKLVFTIFRILITIVIISLPIMVAVGAAVYLGSPLLTGLFSSLEAASGRQEVIAVMLMFLFLIAIGLAVLAYFTIFCFTLQAVVIEHKSPINAVKRSFELVTADFKAVYGYFLLFSFITSAIYFSLQGLVTAGAGLVYLGSKLMNLQVNYQQFIMSAYSYTRPPLNVINLLIISPLSYIMLTILYFNQRYRVEGYDLILRLKRIKNSKEGAAE